MLAGKLAGLEDAGGLNDDVNAQLAPRQILGIALAQDLHGMAVGHEAILGDLDRIEGAAVDRVILQQVSHRRDVAEVVDGQDLDLRVLDHGAVRQTSDAAETVDAYFDCHCVSPFHSDTQVMGHTKRKCNGKSNACDGYLADGRQAKTNASRLAAGRR